MADTADVIQQRLLQFSVHVFGLKAQVPGIRLDNVPVGGPTRLRTVLAIAVACAVLVVSAVGYLRLWPMHFATPRPASSVASQSANVRLQDIEVVSGRTAWAWLLSVPSGTSIVLATNDAGRIWRKLSVPASAGADEKLGLQVIDGTHAMLQLRRGLFATSNGGRTWRNVALPLGQRVGFGAQFLDPEQGWYIDRAVYPGREQPTAMWWTSNGGASWSELWRVDARHPQVGGVPLEGIKYVLGFRDRATGWLSVWMGNSGRLLETSDGGHTWSPLDLPLGEPSVAADLKLLPGGAAVLLMRTQSGWLALPSRDGGRTWEEPQRVPIGPPLPGGAYDRPAFTDHDHWVVAAASGLRVTKDAGRTWQDIDVSLPAGITGLHDLWLTAGGQGWATAGHGLNDLRVLYTSDGGVHWSQLHVPYMT